MDSYDFLRKEWYELNPDIEDNVDVMFTETKKRRVHVPRGYEERERKMCYPNPEIIKGLIKVMAKYRVDSSVSLREAQDLIYSVEREHTEGDTKIISVGGVCTLFDRLEKELGISIKETYADKRAANRAKRVALANSEGRKRDYHVSTATRKKLEVQKRVTQANKDLAQLDVDRKRLQRLAARNAAKLKLKNNPTKYQEDPEDGNKLVYVDGKKHVKPTKKEIVHDPDLNLVQKYMDGLAQAWDEHELLELYKEILRKKVKFDQRTIAFLPTPRQYLFLSAPEDIVLYGGAAGGGKSYAMVLDATRHVDKSYYNAVIIRKTSPELAKLISDAYELYPIMFPGCKFNSSEGIWKFPSGATISFSFLDKPNDKYKYQGREYQYVGFDELSQHSTDEGFQYLFTRLRDPKEGMASYLRGTANPGAMWVYEMFIKDREENVPFILPGTESFERPTTVRFIPAKLADNPYLSNGDYEGKLRAFGGVLSSQLLEGDWLASVDNKWPEFKLDTHVVDPYPVPPHWNRVAGIDYGYRDPSAVVWFAVNPDNGNIVVYKEFMEAGLTGRELALRIMEEEERELVRVEHPVDWQVYAKTGHTGPSIAESMFSVPGFNMRRADKSREAGWTQIHELMRSDPNTNMPRLEVMSNCKNLIKQIMSAKISKLTTRPNDIDETRVSGHHWDLLDAFRYGVMSRPRMETFQERMAWASQTNKWQKYNDYFS